MIEQRKLERFNLTATAWIDLCLEGGVRRTVEAYVQNISSDGVFIRLSNADIPQNETFAVSILISIKKLSELFGIDDRVLIKANGKVRRTEPDGAAIKFVGKRRLTSPPRELVGIA
ncbi:MAG: PilZ domain-containing protein [Spirochaetales bacterium]|mgnify:CR=1 FL=1|jgi:hypothetical protein|nr:PilZ domain-containing protein [Spirochaetales bacterium]